VDPKKVATILD
jgi:hypothetical protein